LLENFVELGIFTELFHVDVWVVADGFVFTIVYDNSETFHWAVLFFLSVVEIVLFSKKDARTEGFGVRSSCEVAAFDVEADAASLFSVLLSLDLL
jgi:hypothetical protein